MAKIGGNLKKFYLSFCLPAFLMFSSQVVAQEQNDRASGDSQAAKTLPNAPVPRCKFIASGDCVANVEENDYQTGQQSGGQDAAQSPADSSATSGRKDTTRNPDPSRGWALGVNPTTTTGKVSLGDEFFGLAESTVGPRALFLQAFRTGIRMANPPSKYPPEWRQGAQAFGRMYGDRLAVQASTQTAKFLTGALMHEDLRYKPSTSKNPFARTLHAVTFTFIDKTDSGHNTIALSNFVGAAAGGFVGNTYLPAGFNNLSHAGNRSAFEFGSFAVSNVMREFSPEIGSFARKIHLPRFPVPAWWVREK